jgi:hypothetical protein
VLEPLFADLAVRLHPSRSSVANRLMFDQSMLVMA